MFYLISLFWILSFTGLLVLLTKKKFGFVCILSFVIETLLIYICCFFNQLRLGYYLSYIGIIIFFILLIKTVISKDKNRIKEFINNYFSIGFFVFIILLIYCFVLFKYKGYEFCDEFTHWGPMIIASLKTNGFYAQPQNILDFHQDYPPFFSLLECLWCGFDNFHYSETYAYVAINSFMFSDFIPMFENLNIKNKKDILKSLIGIVCVILVGLTISKTKTASDYAHVYTSIYADWALALFCAYSIFFVYKENEWKLFGYFNLSICLISLLLMKQMGICLYALVLFYAFIKITFIDKKITTKKLLIGIICFFGVPLCFYLSWKKIINLYELNGQFVISDFKYNDLLNIIRGKTELTWKTETFYNFKDALLNRKIVLHPFELTYFVSGILISLLMFISLRDKKKIFFTPVVYLIGLIGYAIAMMLLYVLAFGIDEAPVLASFDRYMMSYLYVGITLTVMIGFDSSTYKKSVICSILVLLILMLFVEYKDINEIIPKFSIDKSNDKKVLVVRQFGDTEFNREELNGFRMEFEPRYITEGSYCNANGYLSFENQKEWIETLEQYDLMLIDGYDDFFYQNCWLPLNQKEDLLCYNGWLYSIEKNNNGSLVLSYNDRDFMYYVKQYYMLDYGTEK